MAPGAAAAIARFYREIVGARTRMLDDAGNAVAAVQCGTDQQIRYRETAGPIGPYDGWHIQIYVGDFTGVHRSLEARGLVAEESNTHQYRFTDIVDLDDGRKLATVEHEVRSVLHPMFGRPLVNRNPAQSVGAYTLGSDAWVQGGTPIRLGAKKVAVMPT